MQKETNLDSYVIEGTQHISTNSKAYFDFLIKLEIIDEKETIPKENYKGKVKCVEPGDKVLSHLYDNTIYWVRLTEIQSLILSLSSIKLDISYFDSMETEYENAVVETETGKRDYYTLKYNLILKD